MKKMVVKAIIVALVAAALIGLSVLTAVCVCAARTFESRPADCVIVLGAHVWMDGRMSNALTYRCETALAAWQDGLVQNVIVCGAQGDNEPEAEAAAMWRWMIGKGVPEEKVIAETASINTRQNLENAKAIMAAHGWQTAAVCTNDYHLTRALWIASDVGIDASGIAAPSTKDVLSFARGRVRETCSWILYFLRKVF